MNTEEPSDGGARGCLTTAEVFDCAMNQCMQRGLFESASWLGQLALDASDSVLQETICATSPVVLAVQDPQLTGRAHRYHTVALSLMQKGEYLRCHHMLDAALQELAARTTTREAGDADTMNCESPQLGSSRLTQRSTTSSSPVVPPQLQFLCLYSLYMSGEYIKSISSNSRKCGNPHLRTLRGRLLTLLGHQRQSSPTSSSLSVKQPIKSAQRSSGAFAATMAGGVPSYGDPFLCWLHGVVLRELGMRQESATYFLAALCNHPMLWCAWEDLCTLVNREAQIEEIETIIASLEPHFMSEIFLASVKAALNVVPVTLVPVSTSAVGFASKVQRSTSPHPFSDSVLQNNFAGQESHEQYESQSPQQCCDGRLSPRLVNSWEVLLEQFPNNFFLLSSLAGYHYNVKKDLEKAYCLYKRLHEANPYRLEAMDDYSIVLFLRGDRVGLSSLAQQVYYIDPFRAESNYVVGNYYVLMGAHDRGVLHFRRAVAADPTFLAAWTLLGHAYLETKNSAAAVEAYRTAVDIDPRDYRGWYNLGQIYELLQFYHHALYYYWHTTTLRPTDPRMWSAVANCLDREGRTGEAVLCLERAETYESTVSDYYPPLVRRLGLHYLNTRQMSRAVIYFEKLVASEASKRGDVLFAIPQIVLHYLQRARRLLEAPARSPSYDPTQHFATATTPATTGRGEEKGGGKQPLLSGVTQAAGSSCNSGNIYKNSLADQWIAADAAGRRVIEARWEQANMCLKTSERHLDHMALLLGMTTAVDGGVSSKHTTEPSAGSCITISNAVLMEEGRGREAAQFSSLRRELTTIQNYLIAQQQQVDAAMTV